MKKKILCLAFLIGLSSIVLAQGARQVSGKNVQKAGETMKENAKSNRVRMSFNQEEVIVEMFDNPASREFLSLLPLKLQFDDFANAEKIATLPRKLKEEGPLGREVQGDFTYYAPWGNLAVFYKGYGTASGLFIMGRILTGKDRLAKMEKLFTARIEKIQ